MSIPRIIAIIFIYVLACIGWMVLGTATVIRSGGASDRLSAEVQQLWGGPLVQVAPTVTTLAQFGDESSPSIPSSSRIDVRLDLDQRRKGLNWYPT